MAALQNMRQALSLTANHLHLAARPPTQTAGHTNLNGKTPTLFWHKMILININGKEHCSTKWPSTTTITTTTTTTNNNNNKKKKNKNNNNNKW